MKMMATLVLLLAGVAPAVAQSIFNVTPSTQPSAPGRPAAPVQPPAASTFSAQPPAVPPQFNSSFVDPKVMTQFDRLPNESNEAYLARMNTMAQKAMADMERVSREHEAKMKALAPK